MSNELIKVNVWIIQHKSCKFIPNQVIIYALIYGPITNLKATTIHFIKLIIPLICPYLIIYCHLSIQSIIPDFFLIQIFK